MSNDVAREEGDARSPTQEQGIRQHRFTPPPGATRVFVVRHGESEAEVPGKPFPLRDGHGDPALHADGERQAELLADRLEQEPITAIYVTSLRRTHQTAAPLAARLGITPIEEPELREVFLGDWEGGIFRSKAIDNDPVFAEIFREERWDVIPGAEPHAEFDARVWGAFQRIVTAHPDETVMLVAHGGVIGHLLHRVTESRRFAFSVVDNASISEVVAGPDREILRRYNDVNHLAPLYE